MPELEYTAALIEDLRNELEKRDEKDTRKLHSIFIGGGTPSLFGADSIASVLDIAETEIGFEPDIEITMEANPGTAEAARFRDYRACGVNRLSLGVQSFNDSKLKSLGRIHNGSDAKLAVELCKSAGFDNFNLDFMYGLPDQTIDEALNDLVNAFALEPTHISWYQLTIEQNTEFFSRPPMLPDESEISDLQDAGIELLAANGFARYEVSAYSKPGKQSQHNLNYWHYGDYLGIGAGAHGKISQTQSNFIVRTRKSKQPAHYIGGQLNRDAERKNVEIVERPFEFLLNALRLRAGFTVSEFEKRTGVTFSSIRKQVEYLSSQNLLSVESDSITTTDHGYRVLNSILEDFLEPADGE